MSALLYAPWTNIDPIIMLPVKNFIAVEPSFKRLPAFYLRDTKLRGLKLVPQEIKDSGNVGLAEMVDTYMFIGFTIVSESLTDNPLCFERRLDGVTLKLYYDVDLRTVQNPYYPLYEPDLHPDFCTELADDLRDCLYVFDNSCCGNHEPLPKNLLDMINTNDVSFVGDSEVRYSKLYTYDDLRCFKVKYKIVNPEHDEWLNFVAMGPNEGYNRITSTLLYHPTMEQVDDLFTNE